MTFAIIESIIFQIVIPAVFIGTLLFGKFKGRLDWLLHSFMFTIYISWVFFLERWDFASYYFRILWPLLLVVAIFISWRRVRLLPKHPQYTRKNKAGFVFLIAMALIFAIYQIPVFSGYIQNKEAIDLTFPLENGVYYIGQGGASTNINYHYEHPKQTYALDIDQLNKLGLRASGLYPKNLNKYEIYGADLSSPCSGGVVKARDTMPDLTPPEANPDEPEGNYVQISCQQDAANVVMAHMQEGSVAVEAGDQVKSGDPIGKVGNSGNTSEPHLHIHAEKNGQGVPIEFDGRFLVRNSLIWE